MIPLGLSFVWLRDYLDHRPIEWIPFSRATVQYHLGKRETLLINFRADWDVGSALLSRTFQTRAVRKAIRTYAVISIDTDYTSPSAEIKAALNGLNANSVPTVVIYPASSPNTPIVFRDVITEQQVLDAIKTTRRKQ
jgi:thiol:disulfide interchange protein